MNTWSIWRGVGTGLVLIGLSVQLQAAALAQLADVDPALHAAVEALVTADPEVARDSELAQLCREVAEATVVDPQERAAVTGELAAMEAEGIAAEDILPETVQAAAVQEFSKVKTELEGKLASLREIDPDAAQRLAVSLDEGEKCLLQRDAYQPSAEYKAHAETMMREWEARALEMGTPREVVDRAHAQFERMDYVGYHDAAGLAGPPPKEYFDTLMRDGTISSGEHARAVAGVEAFQTWEASGGDPEKMKELMEQFGGGWTEGMESAMHEYAGGMGSFEHFGPGGFEAFGPGGFEAYGSGLANEFVAHELAAGNVPTYEQVEHYVTNEIKNELQNQVGELQQQYQQNQQQQVQERTESVVHAGHVVDHDNDPNTPDQTHMHEIHIHTDGTRHDHTQPGSGL